MTGAATRLDRAIEIALTLGVLASFALLAAGLVSGRPVALRAGIVILLFTPLVRVVVVAVGLALERDWAFVAISLWILGVLLSSLHVARFW